MFNRSDVGTPLGIGLVIWPTNLGDFMKKIVSLYAIIVDDFSQITNEVSASAAEGSPRKVTIAVESGAVYEASAEVSNDQFTDSAQVNEQKVGTMITAAAIALRSAITQELTPPPE